MAVGRPGVGGSDGVSELCRMAEARERKLRNWDSRMARASCRTSANASRGMAEAASTSSDVSRGELYLWTPSAPCGWRQQGSKTSHNNVWEQPPECRVIRQRNPARLLDSLVECVPRFAKVLIPDVLTSERTVWDQQSLALAHFCTPAC